jgi:integrase/recombinase XerD
MELVPLVNRFITARTADGRAQRTLDDYRRVLDPFIQWCLKHSVSLDGITRETIREYVAYLRSKSWKENTVGIHIRNLRAFLRWLSDEGYTSNNLALAVKAPKMFGRLEIPITPDEIQALLGTCNSGNFNDVRDRALILLMADTGLRTGEIVQLQMGNWKSEPGNDGSYLLVYAPKTQKNRYAILGKWATDALVTYMDWREGYPGDASLFCQGDGRPLKPRAIGSIMWRRGKKAGLERCRTHPHIFRKAFVTGALDNGMDPERVRVLAGWTTMAMMAFYADSALGRLKAAHKRAGPVDLMNLRL